MTACRLNPPFRAEHVGSLLRPRALKDAARAHARGECPHAEYLAVLEREIARAVQMQEQIGLRLVTDGEFGRSSWFGFLFERLEGFSLAPSLFRFRDAHGREYEWMTCFTDAPMRRPRPVCVDEYRRVAALSSRTVKANLPSPTALHFFRGEACRDPQVYPELQAWWEDVVAVYQGELRDLAAAGCRYLQLDEVPLAMLCDARVREQIAAGGRDPQALLRDYVGVVNRVLQARPPEMTVVMHMCRGNFRSRWMAAGGYEPIAEAVFGALDVDAFLLEYDSERAGDFAPLAAVRPDAVVVLGLVSSKSGALEDADTLARRIDDAARIIPLERLALSPQCGFASVAGGNPLDEATQRAKLSLVVEIARRVWGEA